MFKLICVILLVGFLACGNKADESTTKVKEALKSVELNKKTKNTKVVKEDKSKTWTEFKNPELAIDYPSDWRIDDSGKSKTIFIIYPSSKGSEVGFKDNINLLIQDAPQELTLDIWESMIDKGNKKQEQYKLLKSNKKKLKGSEIQNIEYTITKKGIDLKVKQNMQIKNGKVYTLTFTSKQKSYSKNVIKVIRMFNSIDVN